MTWPRKT